MTISVVTPQPGGVGQVAQVLADWQDDAQPFQLHPGDVGWFCRFGLDATAAALRTWHRDGRVVAIALLDGPGLVRLTTAPELRLDPGLAQQLATDLDDPGRGVLPAGQAAVEAPAGAAVQRALGERGWHQDEAWTPLRRELTAAVPDPGLRFELVDPSRAESYASVLRSGFEGSRFSAAHWQAMADTPAGQQAHSLVAFDASRTPVAAITVWSAGRGRPGLVEPLATDAEHRGRGYGRASCLAAAAMLQSAGASSITVATPSDNVGAVATYRSAGFSPLPVRRDWVRGSTATT